VTAESSIGPYALGGFDVERDTAAGLPPLALVEQWRHSGQSTADARRLLSRYSAVGYSVVSDSSGLTKLSGQFGLLEVLALIDRPKRILHAHTRAIDGRPVGVWAADNAQMFHATSADARVLLSTLLTVQDQIQHQCRVQIGIGVHHGHFYDMAGGLYGSEAEAIEEIAENFCDGGEIAVTAAVLDRLPEGHPFVVERKDGVGNVLGPVYRVLDGPRVGDVRDRTDERYPIPYSPGFYADLLLLERSANDDGLAGRLADRHLRTRTVVLVERAAIQDEIAELSLLRGLSMSAVMKETALRLLPPQGAAEIKVAGRLAIYVFEDATAAVRFAVRLRDALAEHEITSRIGLDRGPVLVGDTPDGGRDIAGAPVNVASKMAQDLGRPGHVYLSAAVGEHADLSGFAAIERAVSGVRMTFFEG
jgi:class 3 adenylate cyclase